MIGSGQVPRALALFGVTALVAALLAVLAWRWTTDLDLLRDYGDQISAPAKAGQTVYLDAAVTLAAPPSAASDPEVTVDAVVPRVTENSAAAVVAVLVCERGPGSGVGVVAGPLDPYCTKVEPFRPGSNLTLRYATGKSQLVLEVKGTQPGTVQVEGYDVRYHRFLRTGSQHSGILTTVTVTAP